jgi:periplasmic divalent cation tolerance protein
MPTPELKVILSTCPDRESADRIAAALVEDRLAACAQVLPGLSSVYRWQGRVERSEELLLIVKTTHPEECILRLEALHPYEVPEAVILEVTGGSEAYLNWAAAVTDATDPLAEESDAAET